MKLTLTTGVVWDTSTDSQTEEARAWLRENVINCLGMSPDEQGMIPPQLDTRQRPARWTKDFDTFTVTVEREYVEPEGFSWALKQDHITVTPKTE